MAGRFWIAGGSAIGAAVLLGMGLGHFVTTPQKSLPIPPSEAFEQPGESIASTIPEQGPAVIRCTGCGPTLAERQTMADQGAWDPDGMIEGSADPVVQDYMASDDGTVAPVEIPPSAIHRLAPAAERLAAGELAAGEAPSPAAMAPSAPVAIRPTLAPPVSGQP